MKPWLVGLLGFLGGAGVAGGTLTAFPSKSTTPTTKVSLSKDVPDDVGSLRSANENLTESLQECDRKLADLHSSDKPAPAVVASAERGERDAGGRGRRGGRGEPSKEDWERMAQAGTVRVRVPCIRDTPWQPNERAVDRLGLSPQDVQILKDAYAASNKRMTDQIKPLCAKAIGSAEAADKIGASACMDAISNSARKTGADAMKQSLTRAAEVQAGKRPAPKAGEDVAPVEQLAIVLAGENKAFETDLAQKLGPEEAKRLAWAPELCAERKTLRASDDDEGGGRRPPR